MYGPCRSLDERQSGEAIEGVVRQERIETSQLAVDTHGLTDFAIALARLLGFDLCPRLKDLKQRHLYVPHGMAIPAEIASVCVAKVDLRPIESHWDASFISRPPSCPATPARWRHWRVLDLRPGVTRSTRPGCSSAGCCERRSWRTTRQ